MSEFTYNPEDIHMNTWREKIASVLNADEVLDENPESGNADEHDYAAFNFKNNERLYLDIHHPLTLDSGKNKYLVSVWEDRESGLETVYESEQIKQIAIDDERQIVTFINSEPDKNGVIKVTLLPTGKVVSTDLDGHENTLYE